MKNRNSNMELLRIVAMLMIIAYHIFLHCINIQLTDLQSIADLNNGFYCHMAFYKRLSILAVISPLGQVGNALFLIISGYFMVRKNSIDLANISKKLLSQLGFSVIGLGLLSIIAYFMASFPVKLISFQSFNWMSWYIGYYFAVIVIAKLFLNNFLNGLEKNNYKMFLIVLFAIVQFSWSRTLISNLGGGLDTFITGIFLYSIGGYIYKYNPFNNIKSWILVLIVILINALVIGNFFISTLNNILEFDPSLGQKFIQCIPTYDNSQIFPLVLGITIFEVFRRIDIKSNQFVNFLGASTFMIYLVHDNDLVYSIWKSMDWITPLHENIARFLLVYCIWIIVTFLFGLFVRCLYLGCLKLIEYVKPLVLEK